MKLTWFGGQEIMKAKNKKGTSCREIDDEQKMGDSEAKERYVPKYTMVHVRKYHNETHYV